MSEIETPPPADRPTTDAERLAAEPSTECLNCGADLPGRYCPNCGQKAQPLRTPVHHFVAQSATEFFGLDSRLWSTLAALLARPGTLTLDFLTGRRARHLRPLRVYLSATLAFFFLLSLIDPVGRAQDDLLPSSALSDSVTVAALAAANDSVLARGFGALGDERRDLAAATGRLDSLRALPVPADADRAARQAREVDEARDVLIEAASTSQGDSLRLADRLRRARIQRAVLAELPPDRLILPDDVQGAARLAIPDSSRMFSVGESSRLQLNADLRAMSVAATDAQRREALVRFLRSAIGYVPTVLFLLLPVFALLLKGLYVRRDWHYSEHLVFGLHTHAFAFVAFTGATLAVWAATALRPGAMQEALGWLAVAVVAAIPVYVVLALKRVYGQGWGKTALKAVALGSAYLVVLVVGLSGALTLSAFLG